MATFRHVTYSSFPDPRKPVTVSVCLKARERALEEMRGGNRAGEDHLGVWGVVHVTDGKEKPRGQPSAIAPPSTKIYADPTPI